MVASRQRLFRLNLQLRSRQDIIDFLAAKVEALEDQEQEVCAAADHLAHALALLRRSESSPNDTVGLAHAQERVADAEQALARLLTGPSCYCPHELPLANLLLEMARAELHDFCRQLAVRNLLGTYI